MRRFVDCTLLLLFAGCAGAPDAEAMHDAARAHRYTATVTVTADALLPTADIAIPAFSTVLFRNGTEQTITVDVHAAACNDCDTVLGFEPSVDGVRSAPIAPGAVATLCFHEGGEFRYVANGIEPALAGIVRVGGSR
ncbi:MAG: hypothetical protein KDE27_09690 [Planctomycetes bacterium]|nr:hypothetical protein [Planctomycetota bacterium]